MKDESDKWSEEEYLKAYIQARRGAEFDAKKNMKRQPNRKPIKILAESSEPRANQHPPELQANESIMEDKRILSELKDIKASYGGGEIAPGMLQFRKELEGEDKDWRETLYSDSLPPMPKPSFFEEKTDEQIEKEQHKSLDKF